MTDLRAAVLIDADSLRARIERGDRIVLLHVAEQRAEQGIPGAVPVEARDFAGVGGGTRGARPLPDVADLQAAARRWGIGAASDVVLYDDRAGLTAARGWWVLRWAGVAGVRLLDGGLQAWRTAGGAQDRLSDAEVPGDIRLTGGHLPTLGADDAAALADAGALLDVRAAGSYAGDAQARTGGHIPGAISAPASDALDGHHFAASDVLRARFAALGADGTRPLGISCGSGMSAAHTIAALTSIGVEAALYPGSWTAWSADPKRPIRYGSSAFHPPS